MSNVGSRFTRLSRAAFASTILVALAAATAVADERTYAFDFQQVSLSEALRTYAKITGQQIIFTEDLVAGRAAPTLKGVYTAQDALAQLLARTGLTIERSPAGAIMVRRIVAAPARSQSQATTSPPAAPSGQDKASNGTEADGGDDGQSVEKVTVTGTRIRGRGPVGSHVVTIDKEAIEQSGFSTTEQLIRSIPQNFGGGFAQHITFQLGNIGGGSGINLRGLGSDATLTLVNGRRLPVMGLRGDFADISGIPVSAIERVEVLPDSASAIYGSDAVGGVVNFILRNDFEGLELGARAGAVTEGGLHETRVTAAAGDRFGALKLFGAFEHLQRSDLDMADRAYLANNDLRPLGGNDFRGLRSNPTTLIVSGGLGSFGVPAGQDGTSLAESALLAGVTNRNNGNEGLDALPDQSQDALYLSASVELSPDIEMFADAWLVDRSFRSANAHVTSRFTIPASNAFRAVNNLFAGRTVQADYDFYDDLGPRVEDGDISTTFLAFGATVGVGDTWRIEPAVTYGRLEGSHFIRNLVNTTALNAALANNDPAFAFNPFGDGSHTNPATLETIRGYTESALLSKVWSVSAKADGELFDLPAGPIRVALGADYRQEFFEVGGETFVTGTAPIVRTFSSNDRNVKAAFAEVLVPVFGPDFEPPLGQRLDISIAGRAEQYSDFGETANPKIGLAWQVADGLSLRTSYGRSFRAPNLPDLDPTGTLGLRQVRGLNITDPVSPTGRSNIIIILGSNPDLTEQRAEALSAGMTVAPFSDFKLDLDYFDVQFSDRISSISNVAASLSPNSEFASLVDRTPDPAYVAALLAEAASLGTSGGFSPADISAIVDARVFNLAVTDVRGLDLGISARFDVGPGELNLRGDATYILEFLRAGTSAAPVVDVVGTVGNPLRLKARGGATWSTDRLSGSVFVNYTDDFHDNLSSPRRAVESWTTIDLRLSASLPQLGFAQHPEIALSVINVFDEEPSFVNNSSGQGYDPSNADPLGRFVAIELSSQF